MKRDDPFLEIDDLLRSQQPDPLPSPGLESRILRALDRPRQPAQKRWMRWLVLPPALAAAVMMLDQRPRAPKTITPFAGTAIPAESPIEPAVSRLLAGDPLKSETDLLGRDVERAGNFLVNCLPSIPDQ